MRDRSTLALRVVDGRLSLLDQSRLPHEEHWLACDTVQAMIGHIRALRVRGAPMIAVAASLFAASRAQSGDDRDTIAEYIAVLREARPTAVNLAHAMARLQACLAAPDWRPRLVAEADAIVDQDRALCEAIAEHGASLIAPGEQILTHCNTGALATAGIGTAMGVLRRAHEQHKRISVWVSETRPLLQGGRLTAWECAKLGMDYRLITDSMAAGLMAAGRVDRIIVGADRIAANGDVANKIGTYALAVLAAHHRLPFYVAAPQTTVDAHCARGADIVIEQRSADEVRGAMNGNPWAPAAAPVFNPAFDVTPAALISGWILDTGVATPAQAAAGCFAAS